MSDLMADVIMRPSHHHHYAVPPGCRLTVYDMNVNSSATSPPPVCLRRDRPPGLPLPSFDPPQHPHCRPLDDQVHPSTTIQRTLTIANDNSSLVRQSRSHVVRPDPVPGTQYSGVCYQKIGQALLADSRSRRTPSTASTDSLL